MLMMKINACGPCGKPDGFSSQRPRAAGFLWEEGWGPWQTAWLAVFHGRVSGFPWEIRARARPEGKRVGVLVQAIC